MNFILHIEVKLQCMQKISFIILIFLLASCKKSQSPPTTLEIESQKKISSVSKKKIPRLQNNYETVNVLGKIKSIVCTNYKQFVSNSELSNLVTKVDYKFNVKGNVIEEITYLAFGEINRYKYFYDDMGNRIKSIKFDENKRNTVVDYSLLNEKGLVINTKSTELAKTKDYKDTIIIFEDIFKYKVATDTLLDYTFYDKLKPKDSIRSVNHYKNGNLTKNINYSNGRARGLSSYQYDKRNNKITYAEYEANSEKPSRIWQFKYDKNDREINWKMDSFENNFKREIKKSYDNFGNITEEIQIENDKINQKISYKYVYVYDQQNNWIKQSRYKLNGDKVSVLERKITYY